MSATAEMETKAEAKLATVKQTLGDLAMALRPIVDADLDTDGDAADTAKSYVSVIADYLESQNKRFDRCLFFAACGLRSDG